MTWESVFFGHATTKSQALDTTLDPLSAFERVYANTDNCFLLESFEQDGTLGRYSFLGFDPKHEIRVKNGVTHFDAEERDDDPFLFLKSFCISSKAQGFRGGAVGYVSHDAIQYIEDFKPKPGGFPDMEFGVFLDGVIFDHQSHTKRYVYHDENRVDELNALLREEPGEPECRVNVSEPFFQKEAFCQAVGKAKERIAAGDAFQVVLSRKFPAKFEGSKMPFYKALRKTNPSPYQYVLKTGDREIVGSSPEQLVRVENGEATTFPIAGTRPRGKTPERDKKLEAELLADQKEQAEHAMLVDLARNDIGRISKAGTVSVKKYAEVKKFSHVQHLVSEVSGKLNGSAVDALTSVFPAGTLSGAPKLSALKIIDELEPQPRGPYGGAVGFLSLDGACDFAISIRTLFCDKNQAFVQAGAGIVQDSVAEKEFQETKHKAQALLDCLKQQNTNSEST